MLSYLHNIRPSSRRSAVASSSTGIPNGGPRQYHESSVNTREINRSISYQNVTSPSFASRSPISSDAPVIPQIALVASPHGSLLSEETYDLSPRSDVEQVEAEISHQTGQSNRPALGGSYTSPVVTQRFYRGEENELEKSSSLLSESYVPLDDRKSHPQSASRPQSKGALLVIPQPNRPPPPPPPNIHAKPEKFSPTDINQARHGKTKLNLLNPMAILARRKSSQPQAQAILDKHWQNKGSDKSTIGLSDDYDPRIRGNIVHDFSAPQTERTSNAFMRGKGRIWNSTSMNQLNLSPHSNSSSSPAEKSPSSAERQHTPVFKEHFDDDFERDHSSGVERESIKPSPFMYQIALNGSLSQADPDLSSLPPFARNHAAKLGKATEATDQTTVSRGSLEVVPEMSLSDEEVPSLPAKSSPPVSPPKVRSRASSNADSPFQPGELPKRFKSNSSRFSFDLAGVGSSAQEKILEERHRQKAKDKARANDLSGASQKDIDWNEEERNEMYSEFGSIDDTAGFEESVPGINADADEDLVALSRHDFQPLFPARFPPDGFVSPEIPKSAPIDTLGGNPGQPIYHSTSALWPSPLKSAGLDNPSDQPKEAFLSSQVSGLGIAVSPNDHSHPLLRGDDQEENPSASLAGIPRQYEYPDDDDLYFDDGIIEDVEIKYDEAFDESIFDDDASRIYGLPLRDLKLSHNDLQRSKVLSDQYDLQRHEKCVDGSVISNTDAGDSVASPSLPRSDSNESFIEPNSANRNSFHQNLDFRQDNLAAYHGALAFAANQAAMNGEFFRAENVDESRPKEFSRGLPAGGLAQNKRNQEECGSYSKFGFQDSDDFDYDDALSDDPIIAAANAEALENDDEGFYGQEFGFFARATGTGEYANGGYFGPAGVEGIGRSHSGRVNFQEPSLTPITERSEWSNRNSAISLALHGHSQSAQQNISSPGLAQLADMISLEEDDLSLSALMKLRREAWGGSTTSLPSNSSNGSQLNSSLTVIPAPGIAMINPSLTPNLRSSTHSLVSSNSFNSSDSDAVSPSSPTITLQAHRIPPSQSPPSSSDSPTNKTTTSATLQSSSESSMAFPSSNRPRSFPHLAEKQSKGHNRKSSGAESISYVHEADESGTGGGRWVMEKRRVSEGGKVEVLGREVVEGGRI